MSAKTHQLQIRVSSHQKRALQGLASRAGQTVSAYVLSRVLPSAQLRFGEILRALQDRSERSFVLAELNDLLVSLSPAELQEAVADADLAGLSPFTRNYVAAMVERASEKGGLESPAWTRRILPLEIPRFATQLPGLRLHLLHKAPVSFKRRNIFIDSSIGDRV